MKIILTIGLLSLGIMAMAQTDPRTPVTTPNTGTINNGNINTGTSQYPPNNTGQPANTPNNIHPDPTRTATMQQNPGTSPTGTYNNGLRPDTSSGRKRVKTTPRTTPDKQ